MADDARNGPGAREPSSDLAAIGDLAAPDGVGPKRHSPGDRVGQNYRLRRILGRGGMGDVWLAHNETLDVDVAVKFVRPASEEKDAAKRLLDEARAAARLGHPAIVRVFDFGETEGGDPFIVMERLEGEDLATALGRLGRLSPTKAVRTLLPIAHALVAAHAKGIVHRDLKPENVFLARIDGDRLQPKIVDFGIAQVDKGKGFGLPRSAALLGSLAYMSPEQARGEEVDQRADVWSFSVMLYELIAGRQPFAGDTHDSLLRAIVSGEPASLSPGDDGALWGIVRMGLEKDLTKRFPSMRELGETLALWLLGRGIKEDITGASVDTPWGPRLGPVEDDGLGTVPPVPLGSAREARDVRTTVHRSPSPVPSRGQRYLVFVFIAAGVAAVLGIAIGVRTGAKRRAASQAALGLSSDTREASAPPPSADLVRGVSTAASSAVIPVEPLDKIPVDGQSERVAVSKGVGSNTKKMKAPAAFGHPLVSGAPKRTLKDPFR